MGERIRIIDEIVKSYDYKIALFSSFNFEIGYFERAILNKLFDNGIRKVSLFIDSQEFEIALMNLDRSSLNIGLGKRYIVSPVDINGAFHPKMVLLLGEKKAKLIVASANIKTSGYEKNNEVFNITEYTNKKPEYQDIIVEAIRYFMSLDSISYGLDSSLIKECSDFFYYSKNRKNGERYFIGNIDEPIIDQLKTIIVEDVKELRIAVPYFDNKASAIDALSSLFSEAKIKLYIQQGKSTFPEEYKAKYDLALFDSFKDNDSTAFYHGKVFLFKTASKDYIMYGSANCTMSALLKTYKNGGNVECDLMDIGEPGEFDGFFDNLHIIKNEKLICEPITYDVYQGNRFRFLYAETTNDGVECHFSGKTTEDIDFCYRDNSFKYDNTEDEYIVYIDKEKAEGMHIVFDMTIRIGEDEETVRCWIIDRVSISAARKESSYKNNLEDFDIDSDGNKYIEDRMNILRAELMCADEINDYNRMKAILNQQKIMDEDSSEFEDDFIVDTELNYQYSNAYKSYSYVEKIRGMFLQRFLNPASFRLDTQNDKEKNNGEKQEGIEESKPPRRATSEEKRFESFVKSRVKGILNPDYLDKISFEHYLGIMLIIIDVFNRYNMIENVVDIFKTDYVVETKIKFVNHLLSLKLENQEKKQECEEHIIIWAFCIILENHKFIKAQYTGEDEYNMELKNKKLLKALEDKYMLRDDIQRLVKKAYDPKYNIDYKIVNEYGVERAVKYLDSLYGFKNDDKLYDYIKTRYGQGIGIIIEKNNLCLDMVSEDIKNYLLPDTDVIREVSTSIRNTKKDVKNLVIRVKNGGTSGHIDMIKHTISLDIYRKWGRTIIYKDGRKEMFSGRTVPNY